MIIVNVMMRRITSRMDQANRIYRDLFGLEEGMIRLNQFYMAPEVQKGLVNSKPAADNTESEYALTV